MDQATSPNLTSDIAAGRRVLEIEADALRQTSDSLGEPFSRAVDTLFITTGRVIVSGLGKSGHIARKIVATFASTGTPAHYVHPAEASHGDLGMVLAHDCLLMLSNSGENRELSDLTVHAKRQGIPLIGITSKQSSALGTQADVTLLLPDAPEACPMGMAPTTSSTMMLGLGDALAVALMERRGFTRDHYKELHPGGTLGQMLLKLGDIMHTGNAIPIVSTDTSMSDVCAEMSAKGFGCTGVTDNAGLLIGIITDGDVRRAMAPNLYALTAQDIMTSGPRTIAPTALVVEAVHNMNVGGKRAITSLFVIENEKPIGFLHMHDCLKAGVH